MPSQQSPALDKKYPLLAWLRRPATEWRHDFRHRIWRTADGAYQVVRSASDLGREYGAEVPIWFYAIEVSFIAGRRAETIISRHRTRPAAFAACQIHADAAAAKPLKQPTLISSRVHQNAGGPN